MGISTAATNAAIRGATTTSLVLPSSSMLSAVLPLFSSTSTPNTSDNNRGRTSSSILLAASVGVATISYSSMKNGKALCDTNNETGKLPSTPQHRRMMPQWSPTDNGGRRHPQNQPFVQRSFRVPSPRQQQVFGLPPGPLTPTTNDDAPSRYPPMPSLPCFPNPLQLDQALSNPLPCFPNPLQLDQALPNPPQLGWPSLPSFPNQTPSIGMEDMNFEPMPEDLPIFGNEQHDIPEFLQEHERHFASDRIIHKHMPWALRNAQRALQTSRNHQAQSAENAGIQAQSEISEQAQGPARRESTRSVVGSTAVGLNDEAAAIMSRPARRERRRGSSSTRSVVGLNDDSGAISTQGPSRKKQRRGHQSAPNPEAVAEQPEIQQAASSRTRKQSYVTGMDHIASLKTWVEEYGEERGDKHTLKKKDNGVTEALQTWVKRKRTWVQEYRKGTTGMDTMMYDALMSTGFKWEGVQCQEVSFDSRLESLRDYIEEHGQTPTSRYLVLGPWLSRMRQAKNGTNTNGNLNISEAQFLAIAELLGEGWNEKQRKGPKPKDGKPKKG